MLADDIACNPRNIARGRAFTRTSHVVDIFADNVEVDYRGHEVNVESVVRLLTGRHHASVPSSKRLLSDHQSNILVFVTGHGGDEFLKIKDSDEITSIDFGQAFRQMYEMKRYSNILFVADTCQAGSLANKLESPNVLAVASSRVKQSSYASDRDAEVGLPLLDRFTEIFFDAVNKADGKSDLQTLLNLCTHEALYSDVTVRDDLFPVPLAQVPAGEFFAVAPHVLQHTNAPYPNLQLPGGFFAA